MKHKKFYFYINCFSILFEISPAVPISIRGQVFQEKIKTAVVQPIVLLDQLEPTGVLFLGTNPRLKLDESYLSHLDLVRGQVASALSMARNYEEECARSQVHNNDTAFPLWQVSRLDLLHSNGPFPSVDLFTLPSLPLFPSRSPSWTRPKQPSSPMYPTSSACPSRSSLVPSPKC